MGRDFHTRGNIMMNKTLIAAGLAAALGLAATSAQAKDLTGWFVNAGAGTAHYSASANGTGLGTESHASYQITGGWRSQFIGVEAGYVDLGNVKAHLSSDDLIGTGAQSAKAQLSGDGWTLGFNGHFNPTKMWYISARGGLFMWKAHLKASATADDGSTSRFKQNERSTDWYAGVGTGVDFNRHMSLGVNFDFYKMSKSGITVNNKVYTVNFEYRF